MLMQQDSHISITFVFYLANKRQTHKVKVIFSYPLVDNFFLNSFHGMQPSNILVTSRFPKSTFVFSILDFDLRCLELL